MSKVCGNILTNDIKTEKKLLKNVIILYFLESVNGKITSLILKLINY